MGFALLLAGLAMGPASGRACTCAAPATVPEAYDRSSEVFRGRVIRIGRPFLDVIHLTRSGNHRVEFEVIQRWKTRPGWSERVTVTTRLSGEACGFPFEIGAEYLVYVAPGPDGIETGICTGTKRAAEAADEMAELTRLVWQRVVRLHPPR